MRLYITILAGLISTSALAESLSFPGAGLKSLTIRNSTGDVSVAPATSSSAVIALNKMKWGPRCRLNQENKDGHVQIWVDDKSWILDHECRIDILATVPKDLKLTLTAGSGDVRVVGTRGDLDIKVGSGLVSVKADIKKLSALSGSGDIEVKGMTENALIKTGSGDVNMEVPDTMSKGNLNIMVGSGDVSILLPENQEIVSETATGSGYVKSDFKSQPKAPVSIRAKSGSGDIQIRQK